MAKDPPYRIKNMMPGMIMLWYGEIVDIPSGWALCDGTVNTPDLVGTWVRGAGGAYAPGLVGGAHNHNHDFTGDGHAHDLGPGDDIGGLSPAGEHMHETTVSPSTGTTDLGSNIPPYHCLCYIMKLPIP